MEDNFSSLTDSVRVLTIACVAAILLAGEYRTSIKDAIAAAKDIVERAYDAT